MVYKHILRFPVLQLLHARTFPCLNFFHPTPSQSGKSLESHNDLEEPEKLVHIHEEMDTKLVFTALIMLKKNTNSSQEWLNGDYQNSMKKLRCTDQMCVYPQDHLATRKKDGEKFSF